MLIDAIDEVRDLNLRGSVVPTMVFGHAELMEMRIRGPVTASQLEDLGRIQKSQRHLLGLINGVLHYSRAKAGAVYYELADVPLDAVLAMWETLIVPQGAPIESRSSSPRAASRSPSKPTARSWRRSSSICCRTK